MKCKRYDCMYRGQLERHTAFCDYIGFTTHVRDSDPEHCDKYKKLDKDVKARNTRHRKNILVSLDMQNAIRYKEGTR